MCMEIIRISPMRDRSAALANDLLMMPLICELLTVTSAEFTAAGCLAVMNTCAIVLSPQRGRDITV